jgi:hypothetical protein
MKSLFYMFLLHNGRKYLICPLKADGSVRSVRPLLSSPAESFLASGQLDFHDQVFCSLLAKNVFRNWAYSPTREEVDLSVQALRLLHRGFGKSISALSRCPDRYGLISSKSYTLIHFVCNRKHITFPLQRPTG